MLRSLLFAPGDSEKKMGKASSIGADCVILDLEDSVAAQRKPVAQFLKQVIAGGKCIGLRADPDTRRDKAVAGAVIMARGQQIRVHPSFAVIVRSLKQDRRFACIHGGIMEIQLGHAGVIFGSRAHGKWARPASASLARPPGGRRAATAASGA